MRTFKIRNFGPEFHAGANITNFSSKMLRTLFVRYFVSDHRIVDVIQADGSNSAYGIYVHNADSAIVERNYVLNTTLSVSFTARGIKTSPLLSWSGVGQFCDGVSSGTSFFLM